MIENFDQLMEQAGDLHAKGNLPGAVKIYANLIALQPDNDIVRFFDALAQFDLGNRTSAIETMQGIAKRLPEIPKIRMDLGSMLEREHRHEEALVQFSAATRLNPRDPAAHIMVGHMLMQLGKPAQAAKAVKSYNKALQLAPGNHVARLALARALMITGRWAEADTECAAVLARIPGHTGAMAMQSVICYELGRADEARAIMDFDKRLMSLDIADTRGLPEADLLNAALAEAVSTHPSIAYEPKDYSTKKGYHTGEIANEESGSIHELLNWIRAEIDAVIAESRATRDDAFARNAPAAYRLNAWGVVMEDQGHQSSHIHRDAWLSGVYYIKVPASVTETDPDHAGWIEFGTPHDYPKRKTTSDITLIRPRPGKAILFPSYFYHRTIPLRSTDTRICIAFDAIPV